METSKAFSINVADFRRVGINGLLVGLAATLTYVGGNIADVDIGATGIVIIPIISILLDAAVKWAKNNHVQDEPEVPA